jgi:hypothetical protein
MSDLETRLAELVTRWRKQALVCADNAGDEPASHDEVEWDTMATVYVEAADAVHKLLSEQPS